MYSTFNALKAKPFIILLLNLFCLHIRPFFSSISCQIVDVAEITTPGHDSVIRDN